LEFIENSNSTAYLLNMFSQYRLHINKFNFFFVAFFWDVHKCGQHAQIQIDHIVVIACIIYISSDVYTDICKCIEKVINS